jgi:3'(2'), 5'-bisphosphate nucleotidase
MNLENASEIRFLLDTARQAGEAILEIYGTDFGVQRKEDSSPLTEADLSAHRVITSGLRERYPDIPILSEEGTEQTPYEQRSAWTRFWLVDPLDGTKEFVKRNGQFTVNIAFIEDSQPTFGVIYAPVLDHLYHGVVGRGAWKTEAGREVSLPLRKGNDREGVIIAGSLSHPTPEVDAFIAEQRRTHGKVEFMAMGSSLKICLVAEGTADVYPRFGPTMEWDTAAGHAIANAAGRKVIRYNSDEELSYNKPDLHNDWFIVR